MALWTRVDYSGGSQLSGGAPSTPQFGSVWREVQQAADGKGCQATTQKTGA